MLDNLSGHQQHVAAQSIHHTLAIDVHTWRLSSTCINLLLDLCLPTIVVDIDHASNDAGTPDKMPNRPRHRRRRHPCVPCNEHITMLGFSQQTQVFRDLFRPRLLACVPGQLRLSTADGDSSSSSSLPIFKHVEVTTAKVQR